MSVPKISHSINGYSRYDIPENVAFSATPGIIYPARVDFLNACDVRFIQSGCVVRTDPALVPAFTPFKVQLHRFFCPMQLYHPEMRVNASQFDMRKLSTNMFYTGALFLGPTPATDDGTEPYMYFNGNNLLTFLGLKGGVQSPVYIPTPGATPTGDFAGGNAPLPDQNSYTSVSPLGLSWVNADPILCYYDILRNYYSFSQNDSISFAFCAFDASRPFSIHTAYGSSVPSKWQLSEGSSVGKQGDKWRQFIGRLSPIDSFYERAFYPTDDANSYINRTGALAYTLYSSFFSLPTVSFGANAEHLTYTRAAAGDTYVSLSTWWGMNLPFGVLPAVADRFSRLLSPSASEDVQIGSVQTVRQLAVAAKAQTYRDLISAGGNRFSDWLMTFFGAKINHVDRPILLYSSSFYLNSSPVFQQSSSAGQGLGSYAGQIFGQDSFGKKTQRYCFTEPGYLIDLFSIRPLYYWAGIQKDYARYDKLDYFNPIFNEVGYQQIPAFVFGSNHSQSNYVLAKEPCYNEFRSSYDRVLGSLMLVPNMSQTQTIRNSWVQQRYIPLFDNLKFNGGDFSKLQFVDVAQSNACFSTRSEDHFFVNLYYRVGSKSLVSKNFATNLASR